MITINYEKGYRILHNKLLLILKLLLTRVDVLFHVFMTLKEKLFLFMVILICSEHNLPRQKKPVRWDFHPQRLLASNTCFMCHSRHKYGWMNAHQAKLPARLLVEYEWRKSNNFNACFPWRSSILGFFSRFCLFIQS